MEDDLYFVIFKLNMRFDEGCRGYMTVVSIVILYCDDVDMCNHINGRQSFRIVAFVCWCDYFDGFCKS